MSHLIELRRTRRERPDDGFTLIELLVVIIVLGVLSSIVVFAVQGTGDKGKSAAAKVDAKTLRVAQEAYCAKTGNYAPDQDTLVAEGYLSSGSTLHKTIGFNDVGGPCRGDSFVITCNVGVETCTGDGVVPDGGETGAWTKVGDLPGASPGAYTSNPGLAPAMVAMPNGKLLFWGEDPLGKGGQSDRPNQCRQDGDPECTGSTNGTRAPWLPGPIAVYNPATATWATVTNVLPGAPYPNWNPLWGNVRMVLLQGTAAECGAHCGKVFVQAPIGGITGRRYIIPDYLNANYFLFDPVAFDAGSNPWTRIADPTLTNAAGFVTANSGPVWQISGCSKAASTDCGKVMIFPFFQDNNCSATVRVCQNLTRRHVFWDPTDPGGPSSVPAWSVAPAAARDTAADGTITTGSNIVTSPTANFTAADVGKSIFATGLFGSRTIVSVTDSTTAVASGNATSSSTTRVITIGLPVGASGRGRFTSGPNGQFTMFSQGGSATYNPITHTWTEPLPNTGQMTYTCPPSGFVYTHGGDTSLGQEKSAALLPNGTVLLAGTGAQGCLTGHPTSTLFDPATNSLSAFAGAACPCGSAMPEVMRAGGPGTFYRDGVLLWGGGAAGSHLYNHTTGTWASVPTSFSGTYGGRLNDGRVMVTGGGASKKETYVFTPPVATP